MAKKARLLGFDGTEFREIECDGLQDYYDYLKCDCFDIANRQVGDRRFDIFVDDIGLFAEKPLVTAVNPIGEAMLVGNLIFANHDSEGNTTSLTDDDIESIKRQVRIGIARTGEVLMVVQMDY